MKEDIKEFCNLVRDMWQAKEDRLINKCGALVFTGSMLLALLLVLILILGIVLLFIHYPVALLWTAGGIVLLLLFTKLIILGADKDD